MWKTFVWDELSDQAGCVMCSCERSLCEISCMRWWGCVRCGEWNGPFGIAWHLYSRPGGSVPKCCWLIRWEQLPLESTGCVEASFTNRSQWLAININKTKSKRKTCKMVGLLVCLPLMAPVLQVASSFCCRSLCTVDPLAVREVAELRCQDNFAMSGSFESAQGERWYENEACATWA